MRFSHRSKARRHPWTLIYLLGAVAVAGMQPASPGAEVRNVNVQGRYLVGSKPTAGARVVMQEYPGNIAGRQARQYSDQTDSLGKFHFDNVVPGEYDIGREILGDHLIEHTLVRRVLIEAGTDSNLQIGGSGRPVTGRAAALTQPGARQRPSTWHIKVRFDRDMTYPNYPIPADIVHASNELRDQWAREFARSDEGKDYARKMLEVHATPYVYIAEIDSPGSFQMDDVEPGHYRVSVSMIAPGPSKLKDKPRRSEGNARFDMPAVPGGRSDEPLEIPLIQTQGEQQLAPAEAAARVIYGVICNKNGQPLPNAQIVVQIRNSTAASNVIYTSNAGGQFKASVPIGIPISISASASGYWPESKTAGASDVSVDFSLSPLRSVHGTVIDKTTRLPLDRFEATIIADIPHNTSPGYFDPTVFTNGTYAAKLSYFPNATAWFMRIDASGHLPAISPALAENASQNFELTPAENLKGIVYGIDAKPQARATVKPAIVGRSASMVVTVKPVFGCVTAEDGRYDIWPQIGKFKLVAVSETGYAVVDQDDLAQSADIHLTPWGRIEGSYLVDGKPAPNQTIYVRPIRQQWLNQWEKQLNIDSHLPEIWNTADVKTYADGRFTLDHLIDGIAIVQYPIPHPRFLTSMGIPQQSEVVRIVSGKTLQFNPGEGGRVIAGRARIPGELAAEKNLSIGGFANLVQTPAPSPFPDAMKDSSTKEREKWLEDFEKTDAAIAYAKATYSGWHYDIVVAPDGTYKFSGILPGSYTLGFSAFSLKSGSAGTVQIKIPPRMEGNADQPIEIPDVDLVIIPPTTRKSP